MNSYTIIDFPEIGKKHGHFQAKSMSAAARKAFFHLSKHYNFDDGEDGERYLVFKLKKINSKRDYSRMYIGTWVELFEPVEIVEDLNNKRKTKKFIKERAVITQWKPEWESVFLREE